MPESVDEERKLVRTHQLRQLPRLRRSLDNGGNAAGLQASGSRLRSSSCAAGRQVRHPTFVHSPRVYFDFVESRKAAAPPP
jgi:hypothetical protein